MVINKNKQCDDNIHQLCSKFSAETGQQLTYYTAYTGFCKPKHARVCRAIVIPPPGLVGGPVGSAVAVAPAQMLSVQVPPGASAGTQLQVQTPSGPMNVVVPAGVSEGQTFQVQLPAVQPTAAIVTVQATPVAPTPLVQATPVTAAATPSQAKPDPDEDNPNLEAPQNSVTSQTPEGFFCPIHGRFPGETACPKCNPPAVN